MILKKCGSKSHVFELAKFFIFHVLKGIPFNLTHLMHLNFLRNIKSWRRMCMKATTLPFWINLWDNKASSTTYSRKGKLHCCQHPFIDISISMMCLIINLDPLGIPIEHDLNFNGNHYANNLELPYLNP